MSSLYGGLPNFATAGMGPARSNSNHKFLSIGCSLLVVVALIGVFWWTRGGKSSSSPSTIQFATAPQPILPAAQPPQPNFVPGIPSIPQPPVARGLDGRFAITYGSLGLRVDPKACSNGNVWFDDAKEASLTAWNLKTVPGYEDVYYIRSEERMFDKACDRAYLTSPSSCTGTLSMERPKDSVDQLWKLLPSTDGGYEFQSVACDRKRWPSFVISSGKTGGITNTARLAARDGSAYVLRRQG